MPGIGGQGSLAPSLGERAGVRGSFLLIPRRLRRGSSFSNHTVRPELVEGQPNVVRQAHHEREHLDLRFGEQKTLLYHVNATYIIL